MSRRRVTVDSFDQLVRRSFANGVNAVCWPRVLAGDFDEVARLLAPDDGVVVVGVDMLRSLTLSVAGRGAAEAMISDLQRLDALGREPILNCITRYPSDERGYAIGTEVMSFHADRAPVEVDTWLCTYAGRSSEGLDNDGAQHLIEDPDRRTRLLCELDEEANNDDHNDDHNDDDARIVDGSFDLHYAAIDGAEVFSFGVHHLWRIAVQWPGCAVPPCLHRAPTTVVSDAPRLLLIC